MRTCGCSGRGDVAPYHLALPPQFVRAFISRYQAAIFRCPRIGQVGANQLLLDSQTLRSVLLKAPAVRPGRDSSVGGDEAVDPAVAEEEAAAAAAAVPALYTKLVMREFPRVDMLFKLLSVPKDKLLDK